MAETLTLTLLIDKEQNRVVFAESDHRFVDILFSFLTLPIATILRLLNSSFPFSSLHRLYTSVQDLHPNTFRSAACQTMLLRPRNAAGHHLHGCLAVDYDDTDHLVYYKCLRSSFCGVSPVPGVRCQCGGCYDLPIYAMGMRKGSGVFVKEDGRFIVGDDLRVRPVSMGESLEVLSRLGIKDGGVLEKKTVELGGEEVICL